MVGKPISQYNAMGILGIFDGSNIKSKWLGIIHYLTNIVLLIVSNSITNDSKYMLQWTNVLTNSVFFDKYLFISNYGTYIICCKSKIACIVTPKRSCFQDRTHDIYRIFSRFPARYYLFGDGFIQWRNDPYIYTIIYGIHLVRNGIYIISTMDKLSIQWCD